MAIRLAENFKRAFLEVEVPAGTPFERRDPVVRVRRVETDKLANRHIGFVIAVGIFHEPNVGLSGDIRPVMSEFEIRSAGAGCRQTPCIHPRCGRRRCPPKINSLSSIGCFGFPVRIGLHRRYPQPPLAIEIQSHRVGQASGNSSSEATN